MASLSDEPLRTRRSSHLQADPGSSRVFSSCLTRVQPLHTTALQQYQCLIAIPLPCIVPKYASGGVARSCVADSLMTSRTLGPRNIDESTKLCQSVAREAQTCSMEHWATLINDFHARSCCLLLMMIHARKGRLLVHMGPEARPPYRTTQQTTASQDRRLS
jgi:hypothetical protein